MYEIVTLEEVNERLDRTQPVMIDTETVGLYGKIRIAQFYQRQWGETALIVENPNPMGLVAMLTKDITSVYHNAHYDITCVQDNMSKLSWQPEKFHCTFLLARLHFFNKEKFSLDNVIEYTLGYDPYEDKKEMQKSDWSAPVLTEKQLKYASDDVIYLHDVWDKVKDSLEDYSYKLDLIALKNCLDFQTNGFPIDEDKCLGIYADNLKKIQEINLPINCNSYRQVRAYIGSNLSDDLGLSTLASQGNERAEQVKTVRKLTKINSFLQKFLDTSVDGCIFGKFKVSARSGRTTSDDQNLQQIPRILKDVFGVNEDSDEVFIYSDFSQMQLRAVCAVTGDTAMETIFRANGDVHDFVAELIFGKDFTKKDRQICKTGNFGLLFGAGVIVFLSILLKQAGMVMSELDAKNFKKRWRGIWKQVAEWQDRGIRAWKKGEAWETPLGRRYVSKMMTDQLAMQIQGFEAEVAKLAMHYMLPSMKELDARIKLRNFIHDSYIFTCPNDPKIYKEACVIIAESMKEAWIQMCQSVTITDLPMPVNVRVGYNWGDIENGKFIYELVA